MSIDTWKVYGKIRKPPRMSQQDWDRVAQEVEQIISILDRSKSQLWSPHAVVESVAKVLLESEGMEIPEAFTEPRIETLGQELRFDMIQFKAALAVARQLQPTQIDRGIKISPDTNARPYSQREIIRIEDWANFKQRASMACAKKLVISLGLGGGLAGLEMAYLKWNQVKVDSQGVVLCDVEGRDVPILPRFDTALREFMPTEPDKLNQFVLYPNREYRRTAFDHVKRRSAKQGLMPDVLRMRDTFLLHLVGANIPWPVIRQVAGPVGQPKLFELSGIAEPVDIWRFRGLLHDKPSSGLRVV
ncbi:hypothetical protein [Corynebacterium sp. LaCa116]|uniref:hypothetical protein n=1 Tax=Corynebacterium sp. LaCa116 TaxID=3391423 RepID=UPI003989FDEE